MTDWVQRLALVIAKARHGPGLDMGGAHNPRPSEMDSARRFLEMYEYNKAKEKSRSAAEWHRYLHQERILVEDEPGQECGPWHHRVFLDEENKNEAEATQAPPLDVERLRQCTSLMVILNRLGKFNDTWWDRLAAEYARPTNSAERPETNE